MVGTGYRDGVRRDDFCGAADLRAMQAMCSRLWSPTSRFHPGQLTWNRYSQPVDSSGTAPGEVISLWRDGSSVVGFGWGEAPDWLEAQVDPAYPGVADEVVECFEEWSDAPSQSAVVMEGDLLGRPLAAAGFEPRRGEPYLRHHLLDLRTIPDVPVVGRYRLRHVEAHEAAERAACHAASWSDVSPSSVTAGAYAVLMAAWPYRADLDWVAVDPAGEMVASCLVWPDPATGVGLVEPVGCAPAHRGRGLAGAVTLAALHRLRAVGGRLAVVSPRGDPGYPGPQRLYQALGFRPVARTVTWRRSLPG